VDPAAPVARALAESRGELIGFVRKRAGHLVDPEDVVHRAAERALAAAGSLVDPARARAWLFRITRNVLTDELRSLGLGAVEVPEDLPAPDPARTQPCRCALEIAKQLRPDYRTILERAVLDDAPVIEIAKELGITANNANVRLHRARKALREAGVKRCGVERMSDCTEFTC